VDEEAMAHWGAAAPKNKQKPVNHKAATVNYELAQLLYLRRRLLFRTANTVSQSNGKQPAAVFLLGYVFLLLLL
jgi:hypothetical protein